MPRGGSGLPSGPWVDPTLLGVLPLELVRRWPAGELHGGLLAGLFTAGGRLVAACATDDAEVAVAALAARMRSGGLATHRVLCTLGTPSAALMQAAVDHAMTVVVGTGFPAVQDVDLAEERGLTVCVAEPGGGLAVLAGSHRVVEPLPFLLP